MFKKGKRKWLIALLAALGAVVTVVEPRATILVEALADVLVPPVPEMLVPER